MNSLIIALCAAGFGSLSSFIFRKNIEGKEGTLSGENGYPLLFFFSSFLFALLFYRVWEYKINFTLLGIGACVGLLGSAMILLAQQALKEGPAGLTFAFQSASAVFPGILLFLFLGSDYGFSCSYVQITGLMIVLVGLFFGARKEVGKLPPTSSRWLKYVLICFFAQAAALTLIQGRCIFFDAELFPNFTLTEADDVWFMPGQFGAAFLVQAVIFFKESKPISKSEVFLGCLAGLSNFSSTCLLLLATKHALPFEQSVLFPCFCVSGMIFSNIWANRIYHEEFHFLTNFLCSLGIFMAVA